MPIVVVPGDGFTVFRRNAAQTFTLDAMGPLAAGDFIRRVDVHWSTEDGGVVSFAASLGPSKDPNDESLDAGLSLIQRSSFGAHANADGIPAFLMAGAAGQAGRFAIYPGLRVSAGPSWVIMETGSQSVGSTASLLVSLEIWREKRQPKGANES